MLAVTYRGRSETTASWVFITSRAASGEETTTVGTCPRRRSMTAPYLRASPRIAWCGSAPSRECMFPMTGSGHGPGGRFKAVARREQTALVSLRSTMTPPARQSSRVYNAAGVVSAMTRNNTGTSFFAT